MKVIDILNKMSNGDLKNGFKIGWNGFTYTYNEINGFRDKHGDTLSENTFIECCLNDEVEVIEEEEIEEIDELRIAGITTEEIKDKKKLKEALNNTLYDIKEEMNELVRAVNKLNKEREEK